VQELLSRISECTLCREHLPLGPNPICAGSKKSKIVIISQAPGRIAHLSGIPFDDQSGRTLRTWLGVNEDLFYNPDNFAIVPMGFCYPGKGKSGDLPPRPECAPTWHDEVFSHFEDTPLKLLVGQYSQKYYLKGRKPKTLTETVKNCHDYLPDFFSLPHPSPLNRIWMKKKPWFDSEIIPLLQDLVAKEFKSGKH
jgi:uracil-DNA glycosylase